MYIICASPFKFWLLFLIQITLDCSDPENSLVVNHCPNQYHPLRKKHNGKKEQTDKLKWVEQQLGRTQQQQSTKNLRGLPDLFFITRANSEASILPSPFRSASSIISIMSSSFNFSPRSVTTLFKSRKLI